MADKGTNLDPRQNNILVLCSLFLTSGALKLIQGEPLALEVDVRLEFGKLRRLTACGID